jgi:hypothetical protein
VALCSQHSKVWFWRFFLVRQRENGAEVLIALSGRRSALTYRAMA